MGADVRENVAEGLEEGVFGRVVGPHGEGAAGGELFCEFGQGSRGVEGGVTGVEEIGGGVIDVEEDGVESAGRFGGVETGFG